MVVVTEDTIFGTDCCKPTDLNSKNTSCFKYEDGCLTAYTIAKKYYNTVSNVGFIPIKETYKALVMLFLEDYINKGYIENKKEIQDMLDCISKNSCVAERKPNLCNYPKPAVIQVQSGEFTDTIGTLCGFEIENAGYTESLNNN